MQISKNLMVLLALTIAIGSLVISTESAHAANPAARQCLIDGLITDGSRTPGVEVTRVLLDCYAGQPRARPQYRNTNTGKITESAPNTWMGVPGYLIQQCGNPCQ